MEWNGFEQVYVGGLDIKSSFELDSDELVSGTSYTSLSHLVSLSPISF